MTLRHCQSTLPRDLEDLITRTIGCLLLVHRALGPGMSEAAYSRARRIELHDQGIQCQAETSIAVHYKGHVVCHQRLDLLVADELIVEVKSVEQIHPVHVAQVVSYLRAARKRAALLVNFNVPVLREGIRRIVL